MAVVLNSRVVQAYNRDAARTYALAWWNASTNEPLGNANHINGPFANPPGPYRWFNSVGPPNPGDNTIHPVSGPQGVGRDCANFVSQALVDNNGGRIVLPAPDGPGGTVIGALRLGCELAGNSEAGGITFNSAAAAPPDLTIGDVLVFRGLRNSNCNGGEHAMIVVGTANGITLAAHSADHNNATLAGELTYFCRATAYHITSDNPAYCPAQAVNLNIFGPDGKPVPNPVYASAGMITITAPTAVSVDVMTGSPALNSDIDVVSGLARDIASFSGGLSNQVDLSGFTTDTTIWVVATDAYGNQGVQNLRVISAPHPTIVAAAGDHGTLEFPIQNNGVPGTNQRLEQVNLTVAPPANLLFTVTGISVKEDTSLRLPITIDAGQTRTFEISYQLGQSITPGPYLVPLQVTTLNTFTSPAPGMTNSGVWFQIGDPLIDVGTPPAILVGNGSASISANSTVMVTSLQASVSDLVSTNLTGLSVFLATSTTGLSLIGANTSTFGQSHTYSATDPGLSVLGNLPSGRIYLQARDQARNAHTVSFVVDNSPPSIQNMQPGDGTVIFSSTPLISANVFPGFAGLASVSMTLDGNTVANAGSTTTISFVPSIALLGGSHSASVTATDVFGASNTVSWSFMIAVDTAIPPAPTVVVSSTYTANPVQLYATWSVPNSNNIKGYYVAVGSAPGAQDTQSFYSVGLATQTTLAALNMQKDHTYFISVMAQNPSGYFGPLGSSPGILVTNTRPMADADGPYGAFVGRPVQLDGSMSFDVDGDTLTYRWDFGDNSLGTEIKPTHTYTSTGTFTVSLVVNDGVVDSVRSFSSVNVTNFPGLTKTWTSVTDFSGGGGAGTTIIPVTSVLPNDADIGLLLGPEYPLVDQPLYDYLFDPFTVRNCNVANGTIRFTFNFSENLHVSSGTLLTRFSPLLSRSGSPTSLLFHFFSYGGSPFGSKMIDVRSDDSAVGPNPGFLDFSLPQIPVQANGYVQIGDASTVYGGAGPANVYYAALKSNLYIPGMFGGGTAGFCDPSWGIGNPNWAFRLFGRQYPVVGQYLSPPFDLGTTSVTFGPLFASDAKAYTQTYQFFASTRITDVSYFTQTSADGYNWDPPAGVTPGYFIQSTPRRFVRWGAQLSTIDQSQTPLIHDVTVSYIPHMQPPPPTQLLANGGNPSPWTNNTSFLVTLSTPNYVIPFGGAFFKVGAPPAFDSDGTLLPGMNGFQFNAPSLVNGNNLLFVWLRDVLGEAAAADNASMALRFDNLPPQSTAVSPSTASTGAIPVSFTSADPGAADAVPTGSGVSATRLWFRKDNDDDGNFGPWQPSSGTLPGTSGQFSFQPIGDGQYQFFTQSIDVAGNYESTPTAASPPKATTLYDTTPPLISNIALPLISFNIAQVRWNTNDFATGLVEYGTTTALGSTVVLSTASRSQVATLGCHVPSPAVIYYRITAINQTGLKTVSPVSTFVTPPLITVPVTVTGTLDPTVPVTISVSNPSLTSATFKVDGQSGGGTLSTSTAFQFFVSTADGSGMQTLAITIDGFTFYSQFVLDTTTRTVRLARLVTDGGGAMTVAPAVPGASLLGVTLGQAAPGPPSDQNGSGYLASGNSRLYLGYYAGIDPTPPGAIPDLAAMPGPAAGQATLSWTSVGDDAYVGQAMAYDLRQATYRISDANFAAATPITISTPPAIAGTSQSALVSGLQNGTTYFFALRAIDKLLNTSTVAVSPSAITFQVAQSTDSSVTLLSSVSGITINAVSTTTNLPVVALAMSAAAAQGLVFASQLYDILSPVNPLASGATMQFRFDPTGLSLALQQQLRIYHFIATQNTWVLLADNPPDLTQDLLSAPVYSFSYFAVMLPDRALPITTPSFLGGRQFVSTSSMTFVSPDTLFSLTASTLPVGRFPGLPIARTEYRVDLASGAMTPIDLLHPVMRLPPGQHTIQYHSIDVGGNFEALRSAAYAVDGASPTVLYSIGSTFAALPDTLAVIGSSVALTLQLSDPLVGMIGTGSGIASATFSLDGASVTVMSSSTTISLGIGLHTLAIVAQDNVGNVLNRWSSPYRVAVGDLLPPRTSLLAGDPNVVSSPIVYAMAETTFSLYAVDDAVAIGDAVGVGVAQTYLAVDAGSRSLAPTSFTVSTEGFHIFHYYSVDFVGHSELPQSTTVAIDLTAPITTLQVSGSSTTNNQGVLFFSSGSPVSLSAVDLPSNGVASGVNSVFYYIDADPTKTACGNAAFDPSQPSGSCANPEYGGPFSLALGTHTLYYFATDNVLNQEDVNVTSVSVIPLDILPPRTTLLVGTPNSQSTNLYVTSVTPLGLTAVDDRIVVHDLAGVGVAKSFVAIDTMPFQSYAGFFQVSTEGIHSVAYYSVDLAANKELLHSTTIAVDLTPPITTLQVSGSSVTNLGRSFVSSTTLFALSAVDPVANGIASGVKLTQYQINGGALQQGPLSFALSGLDGAYTISYQSIDNVGNTEVLKSTTVLFDQTPPVTTVYVGPSSFTAVNGTLYVTPTSPITFTAVDPSSGGFASGVNRIEFAIDGGSFSVYGSTLTFPEGSHTVLFRAVDNAGNYEAIRTLALRSDTTPPVTTLSPSGVYYSTGSMHFAPSSFTYALPALDPMINGVASGVAGTAYRINGGPFATYSSSFSLAEGIDRVDFQSTDNIANLELLKSVTVYVDATPPVSTFSIGQPQYTVPGFTIVSTATALALSSVDPVVKGVAAGMRLLSYRLNGGAFGTYSAAFSLAASDGPQTIRYFGTDNVGNSEAIKTSTVALDATAPQTELAIVGGRQSPGPDASTFYASSDTRLALPAADPVVNGVASGLAFTQYQDNGGAFQTYVSSFPLVEGAHKLGYQSQDNVANLEVLHSTNVWIDATPPATTFSISSPVFATPNGTIYITPTSSITFSAADPTLPTGQPGSGVNHIEVAIDGSSFTVYGMALSFAEGRHTILYRSIDNVGNVELPKTLSVQSDNTPPQTELAILGGKQASTTTANAFFASAQTSLGFAAQDPVVNGVGSGVAFTRYQDNGGAFQTFTVPITLSEGAHVLAYQSQDNVANLEVLRSTTVSVDATPPISSATIGLPLYVAVDGTQYVTPATSVTLSAYDPVTSGVASGLDHIEYNLDGAGYVTYSTALTFLEGRHTLLYRGVDQVGNVETAHTLLLQSDNSPPITTFTPSGSLFVSSAGYSFASASFLYKLPATDPIVNGVASGLSLTRYRTGQITNFLSSSPNYVPGAFQTFAATAPLSLAEGIRRIDFQSQDNVGNLELLKTTTVFIDATPPVTTLAIGLPKFDPGNGQPVFVAAATLLSLASQDPVVSEVASGVNAVSFRRGSDAFAIYGAAFALPVPDGLKTVNWYAVDNVGNQELVKGTTVLLDNTPPQTELAIVGGQQFSGPNAVTFYASSATRFGLPALDPIVNGVTSGLALTQYQDNGEAFQTFASAFALPEGAHLLAYQSQDRVQNLEVLRSTNAWIDATPPVTTVAIGLPTFAAPNGTIYIAPASLVSYSAADPALPTGQPGSGVSRIDVAVDGSSLTAYATALTFREGQHAVLYRSLDNVGNVETTKNLAVQSDNTPPQTELAIIGGKQASTTTANAFYASADTRLGLPAVDPAVNGVASGVSFTRFQDNSGTFQAFGSPVALSEGAHVFAYQSQDHVQNLEVLHSTTVLVDATPPISSATIGSPYYVAPDGTQYIMPATPVALSAYDPVANGVAAGLDHIEYSLDGAGYVTYASALTFAEGRHTLLYRAVDRVGNVESAHTLMLQSDNTPPVTALAPSGTYFSANGRNFVSAGFLYTLPSTDPVVSGVASGVALTRYRTGQMTNFSSPSPTYVPGLFQNFLATAPFSLAEGIRRVEFQSQDNVGNLELLKSVTVFVDATPPVTTLSIGTPQYNSGNGQPLFVAAQTPFLLASDDPVVQEVASQVGTIFFRRNADPFAAYASAFTMTGPDGLKTVNWYAVDNVGNQELAKAATVFFDVTAPQTELAILGGRQFPGPNAQTFYASSDTRLALPAVDPVVGGAASGLALTQWQDNGGTFQTFASAFSLAEGAHALGYRSQDRVQNLEVLNSTNVWIDATAPVTSFVFSGPYYQAPDGTNYVAPSSSITFSAADPALPTGQPGSGVNHIEVALDGGAFSIYTAALSFAEGRHVVLFRAIDNVGNVEATRTLAVQSDNTPPQTELAIVGGHQFPGPFAASLYASADTRYGLPAVDPAVSGVASGVGLTRWQDNGGQLQVFSAPFTLAEGVQHLSYQSQDHVQNLEVDHSTTALVDATAPLTELVILGGRQFPAPTAATFYASSATALAFISTDPVSNGVASGLAFTRWQDNGGAFAIYSASFILAEGAHALGYQSQDNVANLEVLRSTNAWIDATPPVTTFAFSAPYYQAPDGTNYISPKTSVTFSAADPALATGQPGSGVNHTEVAVDGGAFVTYAAALSFAEGRHVVLFRAIDNVGNVEATKTVAIQSDNTPPATTLSIGLPQLRLSSTTIWVGPATPLSLSAVDPIAQNVASGVSQTFYGVDGPALTTYVASFLLAGVSGPRTVSGYSVDHVANTETLESATVFLDATPPEVAFLCPSLSENGICRVFKGRFPVLGTAADDHFQSYTLSAAPGQDAGAGFTTIATAQNQVSSGTLGVWDTTALSGWQTLKLLATDLLGNNATITANVYIGEPGNLMILGGKDIFAGPQGVAIGPTGQLYVADTRHNRIVVFSAQGAFVRAFGGEEGHGSALVLHHPEAVAVDPVGGVYVADTDADKVLKLSAVGQVQAYLSGFKRPSGVAVDLQGSVYVSDTGNHQIKKLSPTGAVVLTITLPPLPALHGDGEGDKDDKQPQLGRPRQLALDGSGAIYVADSQGSRALKYDPTGKFLLSLPIVRIGKDGKAVPGRPMGVAVNAAGNCWLVSDTHNGLVHRFDLEGNEGLLFQSWQRSTARKDRNDEDEAESKPQGLAVDAQGVLYVADRGRNVVMTFAVPTGLPPAVARPAGAKVEPQKWTIAGNFTKEDGGKLSRFDKAALIVSTGALTEDAELFISTPVVRLQAEEDVKARKWVEEDLIPVSTAAVFGPEQTAFKKEVMIVVPYDQLLAQSKGLSEMNLQVFYWNPDKQLWQWLPSSVNLVEHTVSATTRHFSIFQVAGRQKKEKQ